MADLPLFPKPKDIRKKLVALRKLSGDKEQCNLLTKDGRHEYRRRTRVMWERQGRVCCLHGHIPGCPGKLFWQDAVFAHEIPRGHGAGARDDRIELPDGRRQNGAAHSRCNMYQGSRRIKFNAAYNATIQP